jgi:tetratricopeptide (TPR) repeat protein
VTLALLLCQAGQALGAERESTRRRSFTVSEWSAKKLSKAHELLAEDKYSDARRVMDEMARRKSLSDHERALMWQTVGYIQSSQEHYEKAAESFEKSLALDALPDGVTVNMKYNLGQLYLSLERSQAAVKILEEWFELVENPAPTAYYLLAMAHLQNESFDAALRYAEEAVSRASAPKENWLQLLLSLRFQHKDYRGVAELLETLVTHFPKKRYWTQLSAVYGELREDEKALATLELAYTQKYLTKDHELMNLAQRYLYHEIPYRAARVVEKGLDEGVIESDADAWELLADSWLQAREYGRAVLPLRRAADLSEDGELYVRLAQVHLEKEEWSEARLALQKAFEKGKLENPGSAHLLMGIASYNSNDVVAARSAFDRAAEYEKTRKAARQWQKHVRREQAALK